jgi:hypothetical protein
MVALEQHNLRELPTILDDDGIIDLRPRSMSFREEIAALERKLEWGDQWPRRPDQD